MTRGSPRTRIFRSPSDADHVLKVDDKIWTRLYAEATLRGMSRPKLAAELLGFMCDNPDIIDDLLAVDMTE